MPARVLGAIVLLTGAWTTAIPADEPTAGGNERTDSRFEVVGYLPDYRLDSFDPAQARYLTDLVYFSVEPKSTGELGAGLPSEDTLKKLRSIKEKHNVRLHLCVGGWGRSKGFIPLAASESARKRFAAALVEFCTKNGFDGVDLDWEHPENEAQQNDYGRLLSETKQAFQPVKLSLSIAMAGWQQIPAEGFAAVDRVHLMAYDADGRHSTPEFAEGEVARVIKKGAPEGKICLGIPLYGRSVKDRSKSIPYSELVRKHQPPGEVDEIDGVYFNGLKTTEQKTRFAMSKKLAGVMIWEVGQDASGEQSLLRAIERVRRGE